MLKKVLTALLAFSMCFGCLASCSDETASESSGIESTEKEESSTQNEASKDDESSKNDEASKDDEASKGDDEASKGDDELNKEDYWGFDDYNTVNIKGAPAEVTSCPTTIKKVSNSRYSMTSETDMGTVTITLEERPWGCFNLWSWTLKDKSGKTHTFAPGGTDFEYVHRPTTPKGTVVWSGGNHGNEAFVSLDVYNGETGEKIELAVGQSATANSVHVIEKTKLMWFPDDNNDSIGDYNNKSMSYTENDVYANMTRKYTFAGPQIKLNVDYEYVKDVKMHRSYTCMMPIDKKYGLWCEMYNEKGEMLKRIETLKAGAADYSGPTNGGNKACRALVYGYSDPRYQFDVRVNTVKDSLNNYVGDFNTAFWDMNTNQNKLYFTRFANGSPQNIKAGDEHHTEAVWLLKFDPNAKAPEITEPEKPDYEKFEDVKLQGKVVSLNKTYKLSGLLQSGALQYTALLTDGKAHGTLTYDNNWFTFINGPAYQGDKSNTENGIGYAIIDLGAKTDISGVRAHICNGGTAGILAPKSAKVFVSDDGVSFKEVANLKLAEDPSEIYWTGTELSGVSARYVKFQFECNGLFCFMNELEVYSK